MYPEVFEGFMKQFYFKPEKTQRSFDLISEFRRKAQDHGWTKKEMRSAISKSVEESVAVSDLVKNLRLAAGLDKDGMFL